MATGEQRGASVAGGSDSTRERALRSLHVPATLQVIVGGGGLLVLVLGFVMIMVVSADDTNPAAPAMRVMSAAVLFALAAVSALALAGGIASLRGRNYALAIAGAIAAIVSVHTTILGVAVGIWHLVTLRGAGVQEAFAGSARSDEVPGLASSLSRSLASARRQRSEEVNPGSIPVPSRSGRSRRSVPGTNALLENAEERWKGIWTLEMKEWE